jgi:hypothetical protein
MIIKILLVVRSGHLDICQLDWDEFELVEALLAQKIAEDDDQQPGSILWFSKIS